MNEFINELDERLTFNKIYFNQIDQNNNNIINKINNTDRKKIQDKSYINEYISNRIMLISNANLNVEEKNIKLEEINKQLREKEKELKEIEIKKAKIKEEFERKLELELIKLDKKKENELKLKYEQEKIKKEKIRKEEEEREKQLKEMKDKEREKEKEIERLKNTESSLPQGTSNNGSTNTNTININNTNTSTNALAEKLVKSSHIYYQNRKSIELLSKDKQTNEIYTTLNEIVNKLSMIEDIETSFKSIYDKLSYLKNNNKDDLFVYFIDLLNKLLYTKTTSFVIEGKQIFMIYAILINKISTSFKVYGDWFIKFSIYICPYLIPKVFKLSDFNNDSEVYKKRIGFKNSEQTTNEFLSMQQGHAYLFYSFIKLTKKFEFIESFLKEFESGNVSYDYPVIAVFLVFLDVFSNYIFKNKKENIVYTIIDNMIKKLEEFKKNKSNLSLRSTINSYISLLKNYKDNIKNKTDTNYILDLKKDRNFSNIE